jgi:adenosylcobinamide kinase/adenosylcobinamide-phosphate guanylyltransferase
MGIVPLGEVTRLFVDHAGWMNQKIAAICDQVYFVAAGIPMTLKE